MEIKFEWPTQAEMDWIHSVVIPEGKTIEIFGGEYLAKLVNVEVAEVSHQDRNNEDIVVSMCQAKLVVVSLTPVEVYKAY